MKDNFSFTPDYLTRNGEPWFPIMGEMHYSRFSEKYWRESILKMKAGGVSVISTYIIWIHHEEIEGAYDFNGNKNLKKFAQLCRECGVYLFLRIGPWCHGEVRNGGFPDWLLQKGFEVRTNDERYFETVRKFYQKIYDEVSEEITRADSKIIGVQIENEYGHCGGLTGAEGEEHMKTLAKMAREIGFDVPLYTATGWGGAVTGGLLPVMGGYCDAPWDPRVTEIEPSGNFIFTHERNDHNIGSDHGFGEGITFDIEKFPYLTAELGGGLQVTHHRRPVASAKDIGAMTLAKLGSGVTLLGYYMYHGGTNPRGKLSTLQESKATGSLNDLPEYSYDFNAPIRENGTISDTYKELKLYGLFIKDFGSEFCRMKATIPLENPLKPTNNTDLRHSYREFNDSGYVFINNYQRRVKMSSHRGVFLKNRIGDVYDKDYFFYPFNMKIEGAVIKSAHATPLCRINDDYIFYGKDEYEVKGEPKGKIITLSREDALNAYKITSDKDYLIISDYAVIEDEKGIKLFTENRESEFSFKVYPPLKKCPDGYTESIDGGFATYSKKSNPLKSNIIPRKTSHKDYEIYDVEISYGKNINDLFIEVDYSGDRAKLYIDEIEVGDSFFTGQKWGISTKLLGFPKMLRIKIFPLHQSDEIYLENYPKFNEEGTACTINRFNIVEECVENVEI